MDPLDFLRQLKDSPNYRGQIAHIEVTPPREARYGEPEQPVPPELAEAFRRAQGIEQLWSHQAAALDAVRRGESLCVVSGTASGKTLCYNLPILETVLNDPEACALYLFPTKALAQDQLRHLRELVKHCPGLPPPHTYDADTSRATRDRVRRESRLVLSNPDMVHVNLLPNHTRWSRFLANLRFVVVDEVHSVRGIFGSHCAHVFRRLARLCDRYRRLSDPASAVGRYPQFICCSATIANPREHAEALTGREVTLIEDDGSPQGRRYFVFWNPPVPASLTQRRRSGNVEAVELLAEVVRGGFRSIAFTKWWGATELVTRYTQELLRRDGLAAQVASYRGGYLASHRREVEKQLFEGDLRAVVSTSALELGINIGGLQAALVIGFPGTISATRQQAGRAGRGPEDSIAFLVAYDTAINQYLMNYPGYFFGKENEKALIAPRNRHILTSQLACACHEMPLARAELPDFVGGKITGHVPRRDIDAQVKRTHEELQAQAAPGQAPPVDSGCAGPELPPPSAPILDDESPDPVAEAEAILAVMEDEGLVREVNGTWYYAESSKPAYRVSLRSIARDNFQIVDVTDAAHEAIIGDIDQFNAYPILHPEAIYLHGGDAYFVEKLDLDRRRAEVRRVEVDYYTSPLGGRGVAIIHSVDERARFPAGEVWFGDVTCHFNTNAYDKIRLWTREPFDRRPVNLPPQILETTAYWVSPREDTVKRIVESGRRPYDGVYGLGQALMVTTALFASCYPLDVRYSEPPVPECLRWGCSAHSIFIFDNYQGALGFTELAFARIDELLETTLSLIEECPCEGGCPFCVGFYLRPFIPHDPENMEGWIADKEVALMILHDLLGLAPYEPKPPDEQRRSWRARVEAEAGVEPGGVLEQTPAEAEGLPEHVRGQILRRLGKGSKL